MKRFHCSGYWVGIGVLAWAAAFGPAGRAEWGSIRANNRDRRELEERGRAPVGTVSRGREREAAIRDYRHFDTDIERHRAYNWSLYHPGMAVRVLPPGSAAFNFGGRPYYYNEGVYYEPATSGYAVVAPPPGLIVGALPPGAEAIVVGGIVYYYAGGVFYTQQPTGYAVVPAPLGAAVSLLPPGAAPVNVAGRMYYLADGVYFMPAMENGLTVYVTARP